VGPDVFLSGPGGVLLSGFAAAKKKAQSFCIAASYLFGILPVFVYFHLFRIPYKKPASLHF
jgi:hypothetical protein